MIYPLVHEEFAIENGYNELSQEKMVIFHSFYKSTSEGTFTYEGFFCRESEVMPGIPPVKLWLPSHEFSMIN